MSKFNTTHSKSTLLAAVLTVAPVLAMAQTLADIDVNGDGLLTIDEVQTVIADISTDGFSVMDLNADGTLDANEVAAAQEAGLMPNG